MKKWGIFSIEKKNTLNKAYCIVLYRKTRGSAG